MGSLYFDNSATTKIKEEVYKEMQPYYYKEYGNPSSMYTLGRYSKKAIELARNRVANFLNASFNEIYFTSGGTESDNTALKGIATSYKNKGNHIITTKIEHPAILNTCKTLEQQGFRVTYLNVDKNGFINLQELEESINEHTILISVMFANNEIGTIQPIKNIAKIAHKNNIIFHTDAVQACGNIPIDVKDMEIDMLSMSGHKIYGPKGIGVLYVKNGIEFKGIIDGGQQEHGKRAGTENVAGIVGIGKATEIAQKGMVTHIRYLQKIRDYYITEIERRIPGVILNGPRQNRLPGNANFSFPGIDGNTILLKLDQEGISASSASACSTGSTKPSHVLTAIGRDEQTAKSAIRISFGEDNTIDDVNFLINKIEKIIIKNK